MTGAAPLLRTWFTSLQHRAPNTPPDPEVAQQSESSMISSAPDASRNLTQVACEVATAQGAYTAVQTLCLLELSVRVPPQASNDLSGRPSVCEFAQGSLGARTSFSVFCFMWGAGIEWVGSVLCIFAAFRNKKRSG